MRGQWRVWAAGAAQWRVESGEWKTPEVGGLIRRSRLTTRFNGAGGQEVESGEQDCRRGTARRENPGARNIVRRYNGRMAGISLGIIGAGNLGGALAEGALKAGAADRVLAADVSSERLEELSAALGGRFAAVSAEDAAAADLVVIAVKPHIAPSVVSSIGASLRPGAVVVSVAAGVPLARIEAALGAGRPVVRAMPNLAMVVGESATALCANAHVSEEQMELAESIFAAVGSVARVEEPQMHAVTALSGSGPAYVCLLIEALAAGGVNRGLQPAVAQALACQTLLGAAKLVRDKGLHPAALRDRVTTPAGTTIAGLHQLELHGVRAALMDAVEAAAQRSQELASAATTQG